MGPRSKAPLWSRRFAIPRSCPTSSSNFRPSSRRGRSASSRNSTPISSTLAPVASDAKALGQETEAKLKATRGEIATCWPKAPRYPFVKALEPLQVALTPVVGKPYGWYLTDLAPARRNPPRPQGERVRPDQAVSRRKPKADSMTRRANISPATPKISATPRPRAPRRSRTILADPACFKSGVTAKLKTELDGLRADIDAAFAKARAEAAAELDAIARGAARSAGMARGLAGRKSVDRGGFRRGRTSPSARRRSSASSRRG